MIGQPESKSKLKAFLQEYRQEIKFVIIFSVGVVASFFVVNNETISNAIFKPVTVAETFLASIVLNWIGYPNSHSGTFILGEAGNPFRMEVINNCNGVYESTLFLMAFIALQVPWRRKIGWMFFGLVLFYSINELRLINLFIVGSEYSNKTFVFFHETFWNFGLVIFSLAIFIFCAHSLTKNNPIPPTYTEAESK